MTCSWVISAQNEWDTHMHTLTLTRRHIFLQLYSPYPPRLSAYLYKYPLEHIRTRVREVSVHKSDKVKYYI